MASVFISYSRRDRDFVLSLLPALRRLEHEVWVDTDDIPPSAEWMKEIEQAIRASDSVIFILSPNSLGSRICLGELDFALKHSKRLIPILRDSVASDTVPPSLSKLNWISITAQDLFEKGVASVNDAIVTDLEWVSTHTRILMRATEWQTSGKDHNRLLRGEELVGARDWLARVDGVHRMATPLQREYIAASEADAIRRRRIRTGLALAAGITAVIAGVVIAIERSARLDEEKVKLSQTLANKSTTYLDQNLDLALLLSLAALDQGKTVAARASLLDALEHNPPLVKFLHGHHGALRSVALSPDGSVLASGGCARSGLDEGCTEGELRLWNFPSGEPSPSPEGLIAGDVRGLAFTPDGSRIAAGGTGNQVLFWDLRTRARARSIDNAYAKRVNSIAFSPDGKWFATANELDTVLMWHSDSLELDDWVPEFPPDVDSRPSNDVAFDASGQFLAAATDRWLHVWDLARRARLDKSYGADQRNVEVRGANAIASVLAFTAGGSVLVVGSAKGDVTFWNVRNGTQIAAFPTRGEVWAVAATPDASTVMAGADQTVRVWRANTPQLAWTSAARDLPGHAAKVTAVALSRSGDRAVSADEVGRLILWNLDRRSALGRERASPLRDVPSDQTAAMTADGQVMAETTGEAVSLRTQNGARGELPDSVCAGSPVRSIAFTPAGDQIACGDDAGVVRLVELKSPHRERRFASQAGHVSSVAVSRDGRRLAAGVCTSTDANRRCLGSVFVWDIASGQLLRRHTQQSAEIPAVAFGTATLASANSIGEIAVYPDPIGRDEPTPLSDTSSAWSALAVSADDQTVVTGNTQGAIRLWDTAEKRAIGGQVTLHGGPVLALRFGDDRTTLLSVARDSLVEWPTSLNVWIAAACATANRNLSREDWDEYVKVVAYENLCANVP